MRGDTTNTLVIIGAGLIAWKFRSAIASATAAAIAPPATQGIDQSTAGSLQPTPAAAPAAAIAPPAAIEHWTATPAPAVAANPAPAAAYTPPAPAGLNAQDAALYAQLAAQNDAAVAKWQAAANAAGVDYQTYIRTTNFANLAGLRQRQAWRNNQPWRR